MIPYDTPQAIITTIIPTYRRSKLLGRAIRSVLNQTYPYFKVCVYDNASGDETAEVVSEIAKHDSRVNYFCHKSNIGMISNFIYGMSRVETPFFSFLSDDDVLLPNFFQTVMDGFKSYPDAIFSAGATVHITEHGEVLNVPLHRWQREGFYNPPEGLLNMLGGKHPEWTAIVFRKEIVEKIGLLDKDIGYPMDLDYELQASARFPFVVSKKPCALFVTINTSFTHTFEDDQFIKWGFRRMIDKLQENNFLPEDIRAHATDKLIIWFRWIFFWNGIKLIKKNKFDKVKTISNALYNGLNSKNKAILLYTLACFKHYFPLGYYLFIVLNKIRKLFNKDKEQIIMTKELQNHYADFSRFLNL